MQRANIFQNGHSQTMRLPKEFRLEGKEVAAIRLGDVVVLQPIKGNWLKIHQAMYRLKEFIKDRKDHLPEVREKL